MRRLPNVTPPAGEVRDRSVLREFTWAREFTVVGRAVSDSVLLRANDVVRKMFAYRHDILKRSSAIAPGS